MERLSLLLSILSDVHSGGPISVREGRLVPPVLLGHPTLRESVPSWGGPAEPCSPLGCSSYLCMFSRVCSPDTSLSNTCSSPPWTYASGSRFHVMPHGPGQGPLHKSGCWWHFLHILQGKLQRSQVPSSA